MDETSSQPRRKRAGRILTKRSRPGGPVTSVSFNRNSHGESAILAARGPYLERARTNGETDRLLVFPEGGIIHGIRYADEDLATKWNSIVFGGKLLAFCDLAYSSKMTRIDISQNGETISHVTLIDWIWDVKFISSAALGSIDSTFLAVGMARHIVELWKVDAGLQVSHQLRIHGQPSCQVTSMDIRFNSEEGLLRVAAGTSFQEISVWSQELQVQDGIISTISNETAIKSSNSLHGHAGVVHAVRFSADGQALASTSDDRSVRYWAYDTTNREWSLKWVGWGHTARVWSVSFVPSLGMVASVAEDGTTRLWSCDTGEANGCIQHSSSLWKIDTLEDVAVAGATDGTIQCYDFAGRTGQGNRLVDIDAIAVPDDRPKPQLIDAANEVLEEPKAKKPKKKKKKVPTQVIVGMQLADITSDTPVLLVATRAGSLMQLNIESKEWKILEPWWSESLQESYDIRSTDGCCMGLESGQIAIGTSRGDIVHITESGRQLLSARSLKSVQGLKWIDAATLISFHVASVAVWCIDSSKDVLKPTWICELDGKGKGVPLSCAYDKERLVVGDSRGTLWFFQLATQGSSEDANTIQSLSTLPRAHQKEHILDVAFRGNKVCSVGNDGCLHIAYLTGHELSKGWSIPASSMTGICKLWDQLDSSGFLVSGYYGNTYRMMNMRTGHELFHIDTGGRQRSLHCVVDTTSGAIDAELSKYAIAVCMNQKDGTNSILMRYLKGQRRRQLSIPKTLVMGVNMHSETIFDVCLFQIRDSILVLTGSEDCTSKLSMYDSGSLVDSTLLTPQESSVKAVCSSQHDGMSALLVVGGGKLILQFFLVSSFGSSSCSRVNDLRIQFLGQFKNRDKATIDHRINTVKALPIGDGVDSEVSRKHLVVAGDSDGCCHLFMISEDEETGRKVSRGILVAAGDRPILSIDLCPIGSRILVVLGNTGGDVLMFDLPGSVQDLTEQWDELGETLKPFSSYHVHQMGTNALSILPAKLSKVTDVTICTGGDDQALGTCKVSISSDKDDNKLSLMADPVPQVTKELSYSAIKGVSQFWHHKQRYLLTVGYTQRLALWHCGGLESTHETPTLLDAVSVDLGDVNCLGVLEVPTKVLVAVGGMGVELMEFSTANLSVKED